MMSSIMSPDAQNSACIHFHACLHMTKSDIYAFTVYYSITTFNKQRIVEGSDYRGHLTHFLQQAEYP